MVVMVGGMGRGAVMAAMVAAAVHRNPS